MIKIDVILDHSFQVNFNKLDNWISTGLGWVIKSIDSDYVDFSVYNPLSRSSYIWLPKKLRNVKKGLINFRNKYFPWCHVRHLNPVDKNPQRTTKLDRKIAYGLDYEGIKFPVSKKDYGKIEVKNNICINIFGYENGLAYPLYL